MKLAEVKQMNNTNQIQPITARVLSAPTPRAARVLDSGIAELRKQHNAAVVALKDKRRSAAVLKMILYKRLAQLTQDDKNTLLDFLKQIATPALPKEVSNGE